MINYFLKFLQVLYSGLGWFNLTLNPLRPLSSPWSWCLSPVSVVLSGWEFLTSPGWDTNHRRLAPSRRWYSFTYLVRMESWVGLGGKEGCTNFRILAKPGIEPGTLWSKGRDLTNCANHAHHHFNPGLSKNSSSRQFLTCM